MAVYQLRKLSEKTFTTISEYTVVNNTVGMTVEPYSTDTLLIKVSKANLLYYFLLLTDTNKTWRGIASASGNDTFECLRVHIAVRKASERQFLRLA